MDARRRAIAEISQHCDLSQRLSLVPASAEIRGLYFRSIESTLAAAGRVEPYGEAFPERFSPLRWYPVTEFLQRLTVAGGLLRGPERVHEGMFEIGRANARVFTGSALGRVMLRLLARDHQRVLQQAIAGRRQSARPSRWELRFPEPRTAVMAMVEEYGYLESYMLGAAHGTFEAVELPVRIRVVQHDAFAGEHHFDW